MIFQTLTDLQDFIYTKIAGAFERGICVDNFDNYTLMIDTFTVPVEFELLDPTKSSTKF